MRRSMTWQGLAGFATLLVARDGRVLVRNAYSGCCALSTDVGYGYGWFVAQVSGRPYAYRWGHIDGFVSTNGFDAADGTVVIALSNLETTPTFAMSASLQQLALEAR